MSDYQYNALKAMRKHPIANKWKAYESAKANYDPRKHGDYEAYVKQISEALRL